MQRAVCTTARVGADKSNYWYPTMYYMHENNTYEAMTPLNTRIYYFTKNETNMNPFPPGLRIISGTAMSRDVNDTRTVGVQFTCGNGDPESKYMPNGTSHPSCESLHVGIHFPSCGLASQVLDSENHFDHLTWPLDSAGNPDPNAGLCPPSHPM